MEEQVQVHYLEIVTPQPEQLCEAYSQSLKLRFSAPIAELGGARTAMLSNGGTLGIRAPLHQAEEPTTRPYYLVADIHKAVDEAKSAGAHIAVPPMEIPGHGKCAIMMFGVVQSGFWQI
jgi:predicted enzyme related to lactoylglutathione lyase